MARNWVPPADLEHSLGTNVKRWLEAHFKDFIGYGSLKLYELPDSVDELENFATVYAKDDRNIYVKRSDGSEFQIAEVLHLHGTEILVNYNEASPRLIYTVPSNSFLNEVEILIVTPWNGTGASLTIGTDADPILLFSSSEIDLTTSDILFYKSYVKPGITSVKAFITPGTGASAGQVRIKLQTI